MVPDSFTDFFVASAGVAGALVGLLFVALSVTPEPKSPEQRLDIDARASVAFSALTDALVLSLFAVIPGVNLGVPALVTGLGALASCVGVGVILWRTAQRRGRRRRLGALGLQSLVFIYQVVTGFQLVADPHSQLAIRTLAILTVVLFLVGIARAWALVGVRDTSLLHAIRHAIHDRSEDRTPPGQPAVPAED